MSASKIAKMERDQVEKGNRRDARKRELAEHSIHTLAKLGFARTSLRDIAEQSGVSVGVLHYYFEDKSALIVYCVERYIDSFHDILDEIQAEQGPIIDLIHNYVESMVSQVAEHAHIYRLYYDFRSQALFDTTLQEPLVDIEQKTIELVRRFLERLEVTANPINIYAQQDGLLRYYLQRKLMGDDNAADDLRKRLWGIFKFFGVIRDTPDTD